MDRYYQSAASTSKAPKRPRTEAQAVPNEYGDDVTPVSTPPTPDPPSSPTAVGGNNGSDLSPDQHLAYSLILGGHNTALCGSAGSGKTFLLRRVVQALRDRGRVVCVTASTGSAALNIEPGATTLHSFVGGGLCTEPAETLAPQICRKNPPARKRWREVGVLVIDEISMVQPDLFERIETIARLIRATAAPFGGIQVVLCGDWAQLAPIADRPRSDAPPSHAKMDFCFETDAWARVVQRVVVLKTIFRQQSDQPFVRLLNEMRRGRLGPESLALLRSRVGAQLRCPPNVRPTVLVPIRAQAERMNAQALARLPGPSVVFAPEKTHPNLTAARAGPLFDKLAKALAIDQLTLKVGAPVVLVVNLSPERGLMNGSQGVVESFDVEGMPIVRFVNGALVPMKRYSWQRAERASPNGGDDQDGGGHDEPMPTRGKRKGKRDAGFSGVIVRQVPLLLAFAISIHRAQGMTLECVELSLGPSIFSDGQVRALVVPPSSLPFAVSRPTLA
ncbi:ATP-dependent DNA helicase [uncultured virus]|nr:ATP-dependent DNA helicase [uncultured virus]